MTCSVFCWSGMTQISKELRPDTISDHAAAERERERGGEGRLHYVCVKKYKCVCERGGERCSPSMALAPMKLTVTIPRSVPGRPARATYRLSTYILSPALLCEDMLQWTAEAEQE